MFLQLHCVPVPSAEPCLLIPSVQPSSGTRSTDVAVIIGLQACGKDGNCDAVAKDYGRVLYHGPYNPKQGHGHEGGAHNYTVRIPENTAAGKALLQVAHFFYAGVRVSYTLCALSEPERVTVTLHVLGPQSSQDGDSPHCSSDHSMTRRCS